MELNYLSQEEREMLTLQVSDPRAQRELLEWANHARHQAACVNLILKGEAKVQVDPDLGVALQRNAPASSRRPLCRGRRIAS